MKKRKKNIVSRKELIEKIVSSQTCDENEAEELREILKSFTLEELIRMNESTEVNLCGLWNDDDLDDEYFDNCSGIYDNPYDGRLY